MAKQKLKLSFSVFSSSTKLVLHLSITCVVVGRAAFTVESTHHEFLSDTHGSHEVLPQCAPVDMIFNRLVVRPHGNPFALSCIGEPPADEHMRLCEVFDIPLLEGANVYADPNATELLGIRDASEDAANHCDPKQVWKDAIYRGYLQVRFSVSDSTISS